MEKRVTISVMTTYNPDDAETTLEEKAKLFDVMQTLTKLDHKTSGNLEYTITEEEVKTEEEKLEDEMKEDEQTLNE